MSWLRFALPLLILIAVGGYLVAAPQPGSAGADCTITVDSTLDDANPDGVVTLREAARFANGTANPTIGEVDEITGCPDPGADTSDRIIFSPGIFDVASPPVINIDQPILMAASNDSIEGSLTFGTWVDGGGYGTDCLRILNASNDSIANMVVRNCSSGIHIVANAAGRGRVGGAAVVGEASHNTLVHNFTGSNNVGIEISGEGAHDNALYYNTVGLTYGSPNIADPNFYGIRVQDAPGNVIGGPLPFRARKFVEAGSAIPISNAISGNTGPGIAIYGDVSDGNVIQGNIIGTQFDGNGPAIPNAKGIDIDGASDTQIGGTALGDGNVISGNAGYGIFICCDSATGATVEGNLIGTNGAGQQAVPNGDGGVLIQRSRANMVGGSSPASRNIISGNMGSGVAIVEGAADNVVQGNYIGTNAAGNAAIPNNGGYRQDDSPDSVIRDNVISGNNGPGIAMFSPGTSGSLIYGNYIGVGKNGEQALGNGDQGILVAGTGPNMIGGTIFGQPNIIAHNGLAGVDIRLHPVVSHRKTIRGNSIHDNGGLGIDLEGDGVTMNDPGDGDDGGNALQNFPDMTDVFDLGSDLEVHVSLDSLPSTAFTLDFYVNGECDPSGFGEGLNHVDDSFGIVTDGAGHAEATLTMGANASAGDLITATATDPDGNTSEFSACVEVAEAPPTPTPTATATPVPTATATPTPGPSGTPSGKLLGDTDCDLDVDAVDSLWVLRELAALSFTAKCIDAGDVQCDGDRDAVDALGIQRHVAGLPAIAQQPGCRAIGT